MSKTKVYVGNLPPDIRPRDIEDLFVKYGKIADIDLKNKRGPPFAFVEFEDERDAEDAVRSRDGYNYDGYALRVEFPRGVSYHNGHDNYGRGGGGMSFKNRGPPSSRSEYRVFVSGLPASGSWQDLKDHMREAGDVGYADVHKDGTGVVEYLRYEDMKYALKKLDDSKFRSHEGETSYVRVREDSSASFGYAASRGGGGGGSGHRGRSRSRSRTGSQTKRSRASPTYSPMRRGRTRSRSRSFSRSRSPRH